MIEALRNILGIMFIMFISGLSFGAGVWYAWNTLQTIKETRDQKPT